MTDELVKKLAALGLPGVMIVVIMAATGLEGNAAVIVVLGTLGGPFGMLAGLAVLGTVTLISEELIGSGIEALLSGVYRERAKNEAFSGIEKEIKELPITEELKNALIKNVSEEYEKSKDLAVVEAKIAEAQ